MSLAAGSRIGAYEVVGAIGAGGMGEVYRARDTKLGRDVALKVLPDAVAGDPTRVARFEREARLLASLNHSRIAALYGLEDSGGRQVLVMELVDGETLADRTRRGALPVPEALRIARQVAEALAAAHERGIVHRDLKPANVKLTLGDEVKVLDFGLARAFETGPAGSERGELTDSPTLSQMATRQGVILGTAAYMAPEQAKGLPVDRRADLFAFGCLLFELLTGRRAFEGEDVTDTLANVLKAEPDWSRLPPETPRAVRRLLERCLDKDRGRRVADASTVIFVLDEASALTATADEASTGAGRTRPASRPRRIVPMALAALAVAFLAAAGVRLLTDSPPAPAPVRLSHVLPPGQTVTGFITGFARHVLAISPDGTRLVYVANNRLFLRDLSQFEATPIRGTDVGPVHTPVFSPDGRSLVFNAFTEGTVKRVEIGGGAAVTVCNVGGAVLGRGARGSSPIGVVSGMTWDASGILAGLGARGVVRCPLAGGALEPLAEVAEGEEAHGPQLLPGGQQLLFTIARIADGPTRWDRARIVVQSLASGARKTVIEGGSDARYVATGHLLYALGGIVFAVPFDPDRGEIVGQAVPVIEGVQRTAGGAGSGAAQFATAGTGHLSYIPGPAGLRSSEVTVALADPSGTVTSVGLPVGPYVHVRASPDGTRLAIGTDDGTDAAVWIYGLDGTSALRRLTLEGRNRFPVWSPDGQRVAFQSDRGDALGVFAQRADGTAAAERLTTSESGEAHIPESWSPDGRHLLVSVHRDSSYSLAAFSLEGRTLDAIGIESAEPTGAVFSPDGRWIAYALTPGGSSNRGVYVRPFPGTGEVFQAPRRGLDFHPVWTPDGMQLIYVDFAVSGLFTLVRVTTGAGVSFGEPTTLPGAVTGNRISIDARAYDILPDGRFVGLIYAGDAGPSGAELPAEIRVVLNWFDELQRLAPPN